MAATRVNKNGIQYDSLTELAFHTDFPSTIRNEKSFLLFKNHVSGDQITYTPDFYDPATDTWIEIKGTYKQFMKTDFQLRWKLAKAKITNLEAIIFYQNKWINVKDYNDLRKTPLLEAQSQLKEIDKLAKSKSLYNTDNYLRLINLLISPNIAWKGLKRGNMVAKRVKYMALRNKLLKAKDKKQVLLDNL